MDVEEINQAFSPSREIVDPEMFVGRADEIRTGILALQNRGGCLAIYGPRAVGKTSIALQLKQIAEGSTVLARMLDEMRYLPRSGFSYTVHYVRCDRYVRNIADLLKRILFGDEENPSLFELTSSGEARLEQIKKTLQGHGELGIFGSKLGGEGRVESVYSMYVSDDFVQQFRKVLGVVNKERATRNGLLVLIDEFDVIEDKSGFASIVKSCSSDTIKFGIVGIASSIGELIEDHSSVGRQIDAIRVRKMNEYELHLILKRAEFAVHNRIKFDEDSKRLIALHAEGFPYFVHLLGKEAMLLAFERRQSVITASLVTELAERVVSGRLPTIYEDWYHDAIGDSQGCEVLLKAFAEDVREEIPAAAILDLVEKLGYTSASTLMDALTRQTVGQAVLQQSRNGYFRFADPVFKIYARLRQWEF